MHEPPTDLTDEQLLELVRRHWSAEVDRVEHLPVGYGAFHWAAHVGFVPRFFVTYDRLGPGSAHTGATLEATYAAAAELAFGLDFVVAGLPTDEVTWTVPAASGAVSLTPWVHGERVGAGPVGADDLDDTVAMLTRLHGRRTPRCAVRWRSVVGPDTADRLSASLDEAWTGGPHAAAARARLLEHLDRVRSMARTVLRLGVEAEQRPWVATHGEPHTRNQIRTPVRPLLVDWESLRLAPRERDLRWLPESARGDAEPAMLELFDLEWRLDEIGRYAARFRGQHGDTEDDRTALAALAEALDL